MNKWQNAVLQESAGATFCESDAMLPVNIGKFAALQYCCSPHLWCYLEVALCCFAVTHKLKATKKVGPRAPSQSDFSHVWKHVQRI